MDWMKIASLKPLETLNRTQNQHEQPLLEGTVARTPSNGLCHKNWFSSFVFVNAFLEYPKDSMATIEQSKQLSRLCRLANVSLFLWGAHGIGKSSLVREVAEEDGVGFIDLRCAQLDSVDLRGFPEKSENGRTRFLPPDDLPFGGEGILFLDELNRAGSDVTAALFQLVLDRKIGQYVLPSGWSIVAAGNFDGQGYDVQSLDMAFLDRFCHSVVDSGPSTAAHWEEWMAKNYPEGAHRIISFCSLNPANLENECDNQLHFEIRPTRRSWEMVARGLAVAEEHEIDDEVLYLYNAGFVGEELALGFHDYKSWIGPKEFFRVGMRPLRKQLNQANPQQLRLFVAAVQSQVGSRKLTESQRKSVLDLCEYLSKIHSELAVGLLTVAFKHDPVYSELTERISLEDAVPLTINVNLARRLEAMDEDLGILGELIRRPILRDRMADLLGMSH